MQKTPCSDVVMGNTELINCKLAERIEHNAPELLKSLPQWVMWKYQHIPGKPKPKKPPFQTTGRAAAANDPRTWCSYRQAKATLETADGFQGIGFMLDSGIVVIDLDNCLEKTEGGLRVTKTARRVFELAHSYTEISPSGKGLHIFLRGKMPEVNGQQQDGMKSDKGEMYEARRYITVTGERVGQAQEIREDQEAINQIYELLKSPTREPPQATPAIRSYRPPRADAEVISKARRAGNGAKFTRLYCGDITGYPSKSEAHLALVSMLVYWTNGDKGQIERIFKSSDMYLLDEETRLKWDAPHRADGSTYGEMTLEKALRTSRQLERT